MLRYEFNVIQNKLVFERLIVNKEKQKFIVDTPGYVVFTMFLPTHTKRLLTAKKGC